MATTGGPAVAGHGPSSSGSASSRPSSPGSGDEVMSDDHVGVSVRARAMVDIARAAQLLMGAAPGLLGA